MERCAQIVAHYVPFELVEKIFFPVPENVLLRIAYWSFPSKEEDIRLVCVLRTQDVSSSVPYKIMS